MYRTQRKLGGILPPDVFVKIRGSPPAVRESALLQLLVRRRVGAAGGAALDHPIHIV